MPFVPVPQTFLVEVKCLWRGQLVENTIWVQDITGPLTPERAVSLALLMEGWFTSTYLTLVSEGVTYLASVVTGQEALDSPRAVQAASGFSGGAPTPSQANNVSLAISFQTGLRGRSFHGRNFIIGVPGTLIEGNDVDVAFRNDIQAAYITLQSDLDENTFAHVIASRFSGSTIVDGEKVPTPRVTGITTPVLTYAFFDSVVDAQRRRLPGRGK